MGTAYELPMSPQQSAKSRGAMRFFYLDPPLPLEEYDAEGTADYDAVPFVIVSAAEVPYSGPETYIFAADPYGRVNSWTDLPGSFRGELNHERALRFAGEGYDIAATPMPPGVREAVKALGATGALKMLEAGK